MDVKREGFARKKRIRRVIAGSVLAGIAAISFGLSRLEPAAPSVNRATVWMDGVERGEMIRQVRGPGTLEVLPEAIRWVAARTRGRVERRILLPGVEVEPSTIILELSNPELDQELRDAEFQLQAQEAEMANLRVTVKSQLLNQKSMAATVASEFNQAKLQAEADERLFAEELIGDLILKRSRVCAEELAVRNDLEQQRLEIASASVEAQLAAKRATVEQRLKGPSELNGVLVHEQIERLGLNRLTVDMDGTVVQAGNQVGWAFRGFNPHRKKNKSYYPLFAHLAQTGQILKSRNRPGNVHDSKGADAFLRELIGELRGQFGRSRKLEFRTDAAFFNEKILKRLERSRSEFAIKAPFWPWLGLKEVVAGRKRWHRVSDEIDGFSIKHFIEPWNITVRIAIYRKRVRHRTAKNFQLDLFSPDDGYFEYSAVATNKSLTVQRLWYFAAGRGGQEKTFAELRSQFALDVVPTKNYAANSAWQQLNVLAHNLCRSFQLDTIAETKGISRKRTCTHLLHTIRTIRFRIINKAGRLVRVSGRNALRMATNSSTQTLFERIEPALAS